MGCAKTVEVFDITMSSATATANLTLGQVQGQCVPMFVSKMSGGLSGGDEVWIEAEIYDNAGTPALRLTAGSAGGGMRVVVHVVEFISAINVQSGSFSGYTGDDQSISISTVDTSKAFGMIHLSTTQTSSNNDDMGWATILNASSIRMLRHSFGAGTTSGSWFVVEDPTGKHFSVQHKSVSSSASDFSTTAFTAVDMSKTFILSTSYGTSNTYNSQIGTQFSLDTPTTVRGRRAGSGLTVYSYHQIIELAGDDAQVARGDHTMAYDALGAYITHGLGTLTTGLYAANIPAMDRFFTTYVNSSTTGYHGTSHFRTAVDSGDTTRLVVQRGITGYEARCTWEVVDFGLPSSSRRIYIT